MSHDPPIDEDFIVVTDVLLPKRMALPEAVARFIEQKGIIADGPEFNGQLTEPRQAILGITLFAYLSPQAGILGDVPEAPSYITVVGKGSTRDFQQSKSDKCSGTLELLATSPYPEQAMDVANAVYQLFRRQPGFTAILPNDGDPKQRGIIVKKAWPTDGDPQLRQKTEEAWTFGFELNALFVQLDE